MAYNNFFANPPANSSNVNPNAGGLFALGQNTNTTQNNTTTTTTPSLFGTTNSAPNPLQPQPTQPSLTTSTNTGLFGQQPQQPSNNPASTGTSLFGGTSAPTQAGVTNPLGGSNPVLGATSASGGGTGGGLFGTNTNTNNANTNTNNPAPNPLQPQSTQPSLFGNTNTNPPTSTSTSTGLFGQQPQQASTGGGTFGNTNNPASTGTSLFGGTSAPTQAGATNPFGGPNPVTGSTSTSGGGTGGGLFGSNTNTSNANTNTGGGGLFGLNPNTNTNTSNQQQQGTTGNPLFGGSTNQGSLFSNTTAKPPGSGLFNVNAASNNNTNAGTNTNANSNPLFSGPVLGQPQQGQQSQQQQPLSNMFSSTTSNPLFAGNKTSTGNPFGGSTLGTSTLGGGQQGGGFANTLLNSRPNTLSSTTGVGTGNTGQQLAEAQEQFIKITQSVETVYNAWHPASKDCRFQHIFYNLVDPKQVNMYGRPPNATNDVLWERAVRENPDPTCLVPVIAIGFDDLRERANAQSAQSSSHLQKLADLSSRLKSLLTEHSVSNSSRLQRAHNTQTQLTQRLMRLVQHLHLLIPAVRSSSIRVEEEELRGRLEEMEEELRRGRVKGKLNEMWALLGAVGAFMERGRGDGQGGQGEWAVVDEEGLAQITQILAEQQAGLQHLTKILQKDQKDLAIIMGKAGGDDGHLANEGENMWNSTNSSLRSSSLR